jgi:ribosomal protein S18 acetylase RimI-like enzyme
MFSSTPFSRDRFDDFLTLVAGNAKARWPNQTYLMTSDVAWQFPGASPKENIRLWYDDSGLAAYLWFQPPGEIKLDIRHGFADYDELLPTMLDWAMHRRTDFDANYPFYIDLNTMEEWANAIRNPQVHPLSGNRYLVTSAFESDQQRIDLLERSGYRPTKHFEPYLSLEFSALPTPDPPAGIRLRHVTENDLEERVNVHSASWAPASGFNIEQYLKVRAIEQVFDSELDIVAETENGTFASYTIAWQDPVSGVGSFEPFGTRPEFRGSGVSRAVIFEGLRRLALKGMHSARIYTTGFNHQAAALYKSCGFEQVDAKRTYIKEC